MTHTEDVETTGNFEVFVNGRLAHSKTSGDGYVDTPAKVNALKRAVRDATAVEAVAKSGRADGLSVEVPTAAVVMQGGAHGLADEDGLALDEDLDDDDETEESNASLIVSMLTLVLSIPALIGA